MFFCALVSNLTLQFTTKFIFFATKTQKHQNNL